MNLKSHAKSCCMSQTLRFILFNPKLMLAQGDINDPRPLNFYHLYKSYIVGLANNNYDVVTVYVDVVFRNNHHV